MTIDQFNWIIANGQTILDVLVIWFLLCMGLTFGLLVAAVTSS